MGRALVSLPWRLCNAADSSQAGYVRSQPQGSSCFLWRWIDDRLNPGRGCPGGLLVEVQTHAAPADGHRHPRRMEKEMSMILGGNWSSPWHTALRLPSQVSALNMAAHQGEPPPFWPGARRSSLAAGLPRRRCDEAAAPRCPSRRWPGPALAELAEASERRCSRHPSTDEGLPAMPLPQSTAHMLVEGVRPPSPGLKVGYSFRSHPASNYHRNFPAKSFLIFLTCTISRIGQIHLIPQEPADP